MNSSEPLTLLPYAVAGVTFIASQWGKIKKALNLKIKGELTVKIG